MHLANFHLELKLRYELARIWNPQISCLDCSNSIFWYQKLFKGALQSLRSKNDLLDYENIQLKEQTSTITDEYNQEIERLVHQKNSDKCMVFFERYNPLICEPFSYPLFVVN